MEFSVMDNVLWVTMFSRSISKRARKTLIFALSMWMGFILSCALCGKELLFSLFVSLLVEACAGDIPSIPDHFKILNSFVVAFCNCWCNASRTKGGAKKILHLICSVSFLVIYPFGTVPAAIFFPHSQLFPFACMLLLFAFLHGVMC